MLCPSLHSGTCPRRRWRRRRTQGAQIAAADRRRIDTAQPGPPSVTDAPTAIDHLPTSGVARLALTVDDGVSTEVLNAYVDFVIASGIRLTFFVNGVYSSWTSVRAKLAPLVDSGQVQLGNHTWNHPSITKLTAAQIVGQLERNEAFLRRTYGIEGRPYFRPPYGHHNAATDRITGGLGYGRTVMWYGSLGDATVVSPARSCPLRSSGSVRRGSSSDTRTSRVSPTTTRALSS